MLVRGVEAPLRWPSASSLLTLEEPVELTVDVRRMDLSSPPEDEDEAADEDDGAADGEAEVAGESESVSSLGDEPVLLLVDDDEDEWWWWCFCCSLCRSDGMAGVLGGQGRRCRSGDGRQRPQAWLGRARRARGGHRRAQQLAQLAPAADLAAVDQHLDRRRGRSCRHRRTPNRRLTDLIRPSGGRRGGWPTYTRLGADVPTGARPRRSEGAAPSAPAEAGSAAPTPQTCLARTSVPSYHLLRQVDAIYDARLQHVRTDPAPDLSQVDGRASFVAADGRAPPAPERSPRLLFPASISSRPRSGADQAGRAGGPRAACRHASGLKGSPASGCWPPVPSSNPPTSSPLIPTLLALAQHVATQEERSRSTRQCRELATLRRD
jgi:hypothetical protein